VVMLTHPRNLHEAEVQAAARRATGETRLFSVVLDRHGAAELAEIRHGSPVPLRRFQLDLAQVAPPVPTRREPRTEAPGPWRGDVEPVPFPFRFGVAASIEPHLFDFD